MTDVYEDLHGHPPDIMNIVFKLLQNTYNITHFQKSQSQNITIKNLDLGSIALLGRGNITSYVQINDEVPSDFLSVQLLQEIYPPCSVSAVIFN